MTDAENGSVASFGTLRRAHISRNKVSRTSFYLRVGALGKAISNLAKRFENVTLIVYASICFIFYSVHARMEVLYHMYFQCSDLAP